MAGPDATTNDVSLLTALEELRVTEEELRLQNEELAAAAEELEAARRRYAGLFESAPDAYLVTDAAGVVREANRAAADLLRTPPRYLAGKPLTVFVAAGSRPDWEQFWRDLAEGVPPARELWFQPRGSDPVPAEVRVGVGVGDGSLSWLLRDRSEWRAARDRLLKAERLAAAGQAAATLAHEGRNALQNAVASLSMLRLEVADRPEAVARAERMGQALDRLSRLFEDLRGLSTAVTLRRRPCRLDAVWRDAWAQLEPARQGRDCELAEPTPDADTACVADPLRVEQVFRNLFENALAACADPVRLSVRAEPAELAGRPALAVAVADNGPGLPAGEAEKLFDPFYTTKTQGTGLGLAIARRIADAHGGRLELCNAGPGACFRLTLPRSEE